MLFYMKFRVNFCQLSENQSKRRRTRRREGGGGEIVTSVLIRRGKVSTTP
jgi:hypothetical protein